MKLTGANRLAHVDHDRSDWSSVWALGSLLLKATPGLSLRTNRWWHRK